MRTASVGSVPVKIRAPATNTQISHTNNSTKRGTERSRAASRTIRQGWVSMIALAIGSTQ